MNNYTIKAPGKITIVFLLSLTISLLFYSAGAYSESVYDNWAIPADEVIKKNAAENLKYVEFTPEDEPKYENKIMNYIIALDQEFKKNIKILRVNTQPVKEFLILKDKLYCVKETYNDLAHSKLDKLISGLSSHYGKANIQKDKDIVTYSLANAETKVLVIAKMKSKDADCTIYFYPKKLFRMLITD